MAIAIARTALLESLQTLAPLVARNPSRPMLANVRLSAGGATCRLLATNLETYARLDIKADTGSDVLDVLLPLHRVAPWLKASLGAVVRVEAFGEVRFSTDTGAVLTVSKDDPEEYPAQPEGFVSPGAVLAEIESEELARAFGSVLPFVSREPGRYALHGALLTVEGGVLAVVGTDGRRLGVFRTTASAEPFARPPIIPRDALAYLEGVCSPSKATPSAPVRLSRPGVGWTLIAGIPHAHGTLQVAAREIDGEFARYATVIPRGPQQHAVEMNSAALAGAIKSASAILSADAKAVGLSTDGTVRARAGGASASASVAVLGSRGEGEIASNHDYILDALDSLKTARAPTAGKIKKGEGFRVELEWADRVSPIRLTVEGGPLVVVVMPIRIDS